MENQMKIALGLSTLIALSAPTALAQDAGGAYVNIGEYQGDTVETVVAPPVTYEIITVPLEAGRMPVYAAPPVYTDVQVMPAPVPVQVAAPIYQPPLDIGAGFDAGFADQEYEAARMAAFDTNRDGTISTLEAVATLRPLAGQ